MSRFKFVCLHDSAPTYTSWLVKQYIKSEKLPFCHTPMWLFLVLKLKKSFYLVVIASPDRPLAQQSTKRPILISVLWCISEIEIVYIKPWIKLWRVTMVILVPLTIALDRTDVELLETYFLYIQQNNFISLMPLHIMIAQVNSGSFWLYVQD